LYRYFGYRECDNDKTLLDEETAEFFPEVECEEGRVSSAAVIIAEAIYTAGRNLPKAVLYDDDDQWWVSGTRSLPSSGYVRPPTILEEFVEKMVRTHTTTPKKKRRDKRMRLRVDPNLSPVLNTHRDALSSSFSLDLSWVPRTPFRRKKEEALIARFLPIEVPLLRSVSRFTSV